MVDDRTAALVDQLEVHHGEIAGMNDGREEIVSTFATFSQAWMPATI